MIRNNMMNILMATVAVAALLVGYNAIIANNEAGKSASERLASYLSLDVAKQEKSDDTVVADLTPAPDQTVAESPKEDTPAPTTGSPEAAAPAVVTSQAGDRAETIYTVKDGDTYGCIAEKYYGSYEHWPDVLSANPANQVGFTEYGLHVGAKLVLPAVSSANLKPASKLCS